MSPTSAPTLQARCGALVRSFRHNPDASARTVLVTVFGDGIEPHGREVPTAIFGPEFPKAYTRSIVNRVLAQWKGKEDTIPTPRPGPAVVGNARLMPWSVPGGIPAALLGP